MKLSVTSFAIACALLWGGGLLFVGIMHLLSPSYGAEFLREIASIYPGFHGSGTVADTLVGTVYGFADGAIGGALFAWLYNRLSQGVSARGETQVRAA